MTPIAPIQSGSENIGDLKSSNEEFENGKDAIDPPRTAPVDHHLLAPIVQDSRTCLLFIMSKVSLPTLREDHLIKRHFDVVENTFIRHV